MISNDTSPRNTPSVSGCSADTERSCYSDYASSEKTDKLPLVPTRELQKAEIPISLRNPDEFPSWYAVLSPRETRGVSGPHTVDDLRLLFAEGEVTETTLIWREHLKGWSQLRHLPFLRSKLLQPPKVPPRKDGDFNDPLPPIASQPQLGKLKELPNYNLMQFCAKCGAHAIYHTPGDGEQGIPLFPRHEESHSRSVISEVVPGFLWVANAGGGKKGPIRQLSATLIINCTDTLLTPVSNPPLYRCICAPLPEFIANETDPSSFDIQAIAATFQTVFEYIELEKICPERWADLEQSKPKYQGLVDKDGKPIRRLGLKLPDLPRSNTANTAYTAGLERSRTNQDPSSSNTHQSTSRPTSAAQLQPDATVSPSRPGSSGAPNQSQPSSRPQSGKPRSKRRPRSGKIAGPPAAASMFSMGAKEDAAKIPIEHPLKTHGPVPSRRPPDRVSKVILFSRVGTDRACAVAAAYLIKLYGISVKTALSMIKKSRRGVKISPPYMQALQLWEDRHILGERLCVDCVAAGLRNKYAPQGRSGLTSPNVSPRGTILSLGRLSRPVSSKMPLDGRGAPSFAPLSARSLHRTVPLTSAQEMLESTLVNLLSEQKGDDDVLSDDDTAASGMTISRNILVRLGMPPVDWFLHTASIIVDPPTLPAAIQKNLKLTLLMDLKLGGTMLGDERIVTLFRALATTESDRYAQLLPSSSPENDSKRLGNASRRFFDGTTAEISSTGPLIRRLRSIELPRNDITCRGVTAVCKALLGIIPETISSESAPNLPRERETLNGESEFRREDVEAFSKLDWELLSLDLSHNRIGLQGAAELSLLLRYCSSVLTLNVFGNDMEDAACAAIVDALQRPPEEFVSDETNTTELYTAYAHPIKRAAAVLSSNEAFNQSLTELHLGGNLLATKGMKKLTEILKVNAALSTLHIDFSCELTAAHMKDFAGAVRSHNHWLRRLCFADTSLSVKTFSYLLRAFSDESSSLTRLDVARCGLTSRHLASMAKFCAKMRYLTHVDLSGNLIGNEGAIRIAAVIRGSGGDETDKQTGTSNTLTSNSMIYPQFSTSYDENLTTSGASRGARAAPRRIIIDEDEEEALEKEKKTVHGEVLKPVYPPLQCLDVGCCGIEAAGLLAIFLACAERPCVRILDVSDNNIGKDFLACSDQGMSDGLEALSKCAFTDLKLNRSNLFTRGAVAILQLLTMPASNSLCGSLRALQLSGNGIADSAGEILGELIKTNTTLQLIDLGFNCFTDEVARAVGKATEVPSHAELRKRLIPLTVNMIGNACDPYAAVAMPSRARTKNLFELGAHACQRVEAPHILAYDHVQSQALQHFLDRKENYEIYLKTSTTCSSNHVS